MLQNVMNLKPRPLRRQHFMAQMPFWVLVHLFLGTGLMVVGIVPIITTIRRLHATIQLEGGTSRPHRAHAQPMAVEASIELTHASATLTAQGTKAAVETIRPSVTSMLHLQLRRVVK